MNWQKLKSGILTIVLMLVGMLVQAQPQKVTTLYLNNFEFDENCNILASDNAQNLVTSTDGSTVLSVEGWTSSYSGWTAGASIEYGYTGSFNSSTVPSTGNGKRCLGNVCRLGWKYFLFAKCYTSNRYLLFGLSGNEYRTFSKWNIISRVDIQ